MSPSVTTLGPVLVTVLLTRQRALDPEREIASAIAIVEMVQSSVAARARRNEELPRPDQA